MMLNIALVAAVAENGVIGYRQTLPWRLRGELKQFATITKNHPVLMGRKTFDSLPTKPLPERLNIVLTRQQLTMPEGTKTCDTPTQAIHIAQQWITQYHPKNTTLMVIGGAEIYKIFLPLATHFYYTLVHAQPRGDTLFPTVNLHQHWHKESTLAHVAAEPGYSGYTTELWIKKSKNS